MAGKPWTAASRRSHLAGMCRGEAHADAKLTAAQVRMARAAWAEGATVTELAAECGVARATMRSALRGETWAHIK